MRASLLATRCCSEFNLTLEIIFKRVKAGINLLLAALQLQKLVNYK